MTKKTGKNSLIALAIALLLTVGSIGLSGCSIKGDDSSPSTEAPEVTSPTTTDSQNVKLSAEPNDKTLDNTLASYVKLLGLDKDGLVKAVGENPSSSDEGGLDFAKAGIRVWLDGSGKANQIFTQNKDLDLNGVKIGDKIDQFEKAFGKPVSDKNGDMHFKYNDIFLSMNYDTNTKDTYALYILTEDF